MAPRNPLDSPTTAVLADLHREPRPEAWADFAVELDHAFGNETRQEQAGLALFVFKLGVSVAGEPGVEESDQDRAEALNRSCQPVRGPAADRGRWPIAEARRRPELRIET